MEWTGYFFDLARGEHITADITLLVQIYRLITTQLQDLYNYPNVVRWYNHLKQRESVQKGMVAWETNPLYEMFEQYIVKRRAAGDDINATVWRH